MNKKRRRRKGQQERPDKPKGYGVDDAPDHLASLCYQVRRIQGEVLHVNHTVLGASMGENAGTVRKMVDSRVPGSAEVLLPRWLMLWQQLGMLDAFMEGVAKSIEQAGEKMGCSATADMPEPEDDDERVQIAMIRLRQATLMALRAKFGKVPSGAEIAEMLGVDRAKIKAATGSSGGESGGGTDIRTSLMLWALSGILPCLAERLEARAEHIIKHGYDKDGALGDALQDEIQHTKEATLENQPKYARKLTMG